MMFRSRRVIGLTMNGEMIEIVVEDTGIGINSDFLPLVFEPFRQEHMGNDRPFEGVGLGLSITYGIVQKLGGDIKVESEVGVGTTFIVRIPVSG